MRTTRMFAVVRPISRDHAVVITRHRTNDAAERALAREEAAFRKSPYGTPGTWLDRRVVECGRGDDDVRLGRP